MVRILKSLYKRIGAVSEGQNINIISLPMSNLTKLEGDFRALKGPVHIEN